MATHPPQRIVIGMLDGFGLEYFDQTALPVMQGMAQAGFFKRSACVFPSVTNVNNVSIACGAWPAEHGITANSYFDERTGEARYMNAAELIQTETIFQRAQKRGGKSALLTAKRKSVELFKKDAAIAITAEAPPDDYVATYGPPGDIYSREINYWLWQVAVGILDTRPDIGLVYVHTTDYPMHRWAADEPESTEHLQRLDALIGQAAAVAPDTAFFLTADHGMNAKTRCWDLARVCQNAQVPVRFVLSPERDYYIKHHRNFTGCAWVWLNDQADYQRVADIMGQLPGVEKILSRKETADRYHLIPERVGDVNVFADKDTMFGDMDTDYEELHSYRAHGSLHEMAVPLIIYNFNGGLPEPSYFEANKDIARFLYRD